MKRASIPMAISLSVATSPVYAAGGPRDKVNALLGEIIKEAAEGF